MVPHGVWPLHVWVTGPLEWPLSALVARSPLKNEARDLHTVELAPVLPCIAV